ncbi:MAG: oxidoreductase [Acidimicrobiia bacterium]|nr:oxidoreductase [Acidimicrobiia bacterium]
MTKPTLAIWKFASCDGCQLSLLDLEDDLLDIADAIEIAHFPEATSARLDGPYTVSLVEGSITTPRDLERIRTIRDQSNVLVAIGACATAGGIQALKNLADVDEFIELVYATPSYIDSLATSTPISSHVDVDIELRGCPVDKYELFELVGALLAGRKPDLPTYPVCVECKARGVSCVMVAAGTPCLGPITQAGCGAICPAFDRGCYGCFGPAETVNAGSLADRWRELGVDDERLVRSLRTFNTGAPGFVEAAASVVE